ncbi:ComEC/Rec2 family competence protein [Myxococcota bacterium]|nr:ComEC/Rec2 family competence protein [Myxococcota bacterium]
MDTLPPALVAFLVHWAGLICGGILGPVHALAISLGVAGVAATILGFQGLRPPRTLAVLWALWVTGPVSLAIRPAPQIPGAGLPGPPDPIRVEGTIREVLRRDPAVSEALMRVERLEDPSGTARLPEDRLVVIRAEGDLDLWRSQVLALRARFVPPPPPSEVLGPRWPAPAPRPRLLATRFPAPVTLADPERRDLGGWDRLRGRLGQRLARGLGDREAALVRAVILGEGRAVPGDLRADLADLGTAHILCVSGLHVTVAAWIAGLLVTRLLGPLLVRLRPQANLVVLERTASLLAAVAFAALAGFPVSAVRAAGMFGVATLGALLGRPSSLSNSLGLAGLADLALRPSDAFDLSFDLSYGALLGLSLLGGRDALPRTSASRWESIRARTLQGLRASLAATLGTTPWTLWFLGQASLAGPLANLVVLPVFSFLVMPAIFVRLLLVALAPPAADLSAPAIQVLLQAFLDVQAFAGSSVPALRNPGPAVFLASSAILALAWGALLDAPRRALWPLAALGLFVGSAARPGEDPPPPGSLVVEVLPIGKGDALLVRCPGGERWLVDAGESRTAGRLLAEIRGRGIRSLRGLVLTHADEDHVGGAATLIQGIPVREIRVSRPVRNDSPLREVLEGFPEVPVRGLVAGQEVIPACGDPAVALWPPPGEDLHGNAASLVFPLGLAGRTLLLTGDLEAPEEARLLDLGRVPRAEVLKLGHHGSPGASSAAFLRAVSPRFALVSGYRTRRHRGPSAETRRRVDAAGALWLDSAALGGLQVVLTPGGEVLAGGRRTPGPWRP